MKKGRYQERLHNITDCAIYQRLNRINSFYGCLIMAPFYFKTCGTCMMCLIQLSDSEPGTGLQYDVEPAD